METIIELCSENSILNSFIAEMRDVDLQKDRSRFRENMEACGFIMGYEISKALNYNSKPVQTPLAITQVNLPTDDVVIVSILRAALPLQYGMLRAFREADAAFIGAARKHTSQGEFEIVSDYEAAPDLNGKTVIVVDPMLATASSLLTCYEKLMMNAKPKQCITASVFASKKGIETLVTALPQIVHYTCVVDKELNAHKYIVPGLGDAGDLAFGTKK